MKSIQAIPLILPFFLLFLANGIKAQEDYRWYHDWEITAVSGNAILEKVPGYRVDILGVKKNYINLGLYSFYYPKMIGITVPPGKTTMETGYLFPLGFNYPLKIKKDFRTGIIANYYWTRNPHLLEVEYRNERPNYSYFAGYRYNFDDPSILAGCYVGISLNMNIFINYREMSEVKRRQIKSSLCQNNNSECIVVGFTRKSELLIGANLRPELEPSSTVYYLEDPINDPSGLDSACQARVYGILRELQEKVPDTEIRSLKVMLFYGSVTRDKIYDQGSYSVIRAYPKNSNPRFENTYSGFSRDVVRFGVSPLYTLEIDMRSLREFSFESSEKGVIPVNSKVKSEVIPFLENMKKVTDEKQ